MKSIFQSMVVIYVFPCILCEEFKLLGKRDEIPDGWRLASMKDIKELNKEVQIVLSYNATSTAFVELLDGYLNSGTNSLITTSSCEYCAQKLIIKGLYSCTFQLGLRYKWRKGEPVGLHSDKRCEFECRKRQIFQKDINSVTNSERGCICGRGIFPLVRGDTRSCVLLPTRSSTICNVILGEADGENIFEKEVTGGLEECHASCSMKQEKDETINGLTLNMSSCFCVRKMIGGKRSVSAKSCFLSCQQKHFRYYDDQMSMLGQVTSWQRCALMCKNDQICKFWTWREKTITCNLHGINVKSEKTEIFGELFVSGTRHCEGDLKIAMADSSTQDSVEFKNLLPFIIAAVCLIGMILIITIIIWIVKLSRKRTRDANNDLEETKALNVDIYVAPSTLDSNSLVDIYNDTDQKIVYYSSLGEGGGRTGEKPEVDRSLYAEVKSNGVNYPPLLQPDTTGDYNLPRNCKAKETIVYAKPEIKSKKTKNALVTKKLSDKELALDERL